MSHISNTLFMGKVLLRYKSLKSTNLEAQNLLAAGSLIEGTTLVADLQTQGKGQRGNSWYSPAGTNLLTSFILHPKHILPRQQFHLNIITSLAVFDLLEDLGVTHTSIKWPNDIYIGKNKVAGILIQNNITKQTISSAIIGVGLNVNQTEFDPTLPNPTSLQKILGKTLDLELTLEALCYFLEKRYLQSKSSSGMEAMTKLYTQQLFLLDQVATFLIDGKHQAGIVRGVDPLGKLVLQLEESTRVFDFQEVRFVV